MIEALAIERAELAATVTSQEPANVATVLRVASTVTDRSAS